MYENSPFFKQSQEMEKSFLSWVGHRLFPRLIAEKQYLYQETEEITGIYFIKHGSLAFVFPNFDNAVYSRVQKGDFIGFEDYIYHMQ
jgi:CRP-like cAMP-binding protein